MSTYFCQNSEKFRNIISVPGTSFKMKCDYRAYGDYEMLVVNALRHFSTFYCIFWSIVPFAAIT